MLNVLQTFLSIDNDFDKWIKNIHRCSFKTSRLMNDTTKGVLKAFEHRWWYNFIRMTPHRKMNYTKSLIYEIIDGNLILINKIGTTISE